MKGWIGHGHREHLVKHEGVRGVQGPGPEQAGGAFGAGKDSHTDVPRGQKHGRARVSPDLGLKCWADQLLQMPKKTVDQGLSLRSSQWTGVCLSQVVTQVFVRAAERAPKDSTLLCLLLNPLSS